jgi:hypothetical protein
LEGESSFCKQKELGVLLQGVPVLRRVNIVVGVLQKGMWNSLFFLSPSIC